MMPKPTVFISYSHQDETWKKKLVNHLGVLEQQGLLTSWDDRKIGAGADWLAEIEKAMGGARVAVLLVSANFLNSKFILQKEVPLLLERRAKEGVRIIPVIAKSCVWPKVGWLSSIQARPLDGKPLAALKGNKIDEALAAITTEIFDGLAEAENKAAGDTFLETYRRCLSPTFSHWDLAHAGVAQSGGAGRPIEANLDDMYVDLRLAEGFDLNKTDRGGPISPEGLLAREKPLVIRGAAGSGKTTWMRWTFRRLLENEAAFPLMLVLRDLARRWQDPQCKGAARSLDAFLEEWAAGLLGSGWEGEIKKQLAAPEGPRPVVLVDGWDETGPLGKELREKLLVLMKRYPRLQVVVTSRPYGEGRPSHGEGFELLDIQPLSDSEIGHLAYRFFTRFYGQNEVTANQEVERFSRALSRAPEPQSLARTALLLTMMLLISRSRPIPDKRHLLYEVCIENLLTAIPERKAGEGALLQSEQWRPDDSEERMRVVAALAFGVQSKGYEGRSRTIIVQNWEEMGGLLPAVWPQAKRMGFLGWLAGPAGLLTDRADGTLVFTHLSFQEFLAAWHLNANVEGAEPRIQGFRERLGKTIWWETLRLWAALIERQSRERLDKVLEALATREDGLSLIGMMLADGLGSEEHVELLLRAFLQELSRGWPFGHWLCSRAWAGSRQEERKRVVIQVIHELAPKTHWIGWYRLKGFFDIAGIETDMPLPQGLLSCSIVSQAEASAPTGPTYVAAGSALCGGPSLWPSYPNSEIGFLRAWPSYRRSAGTRLQLAASCGADCADIVKLAKIYLKRPTWMERDVSRTIKFTENISRYFTRRHFTREIARCFALDFVHCFVLDFAMDSALHIARSFARVFAVQLDRGMDRSFAHRFVREVAADTSRKIAVDVASHLAHLLQVDPQPWLIDFMKVDLSSFGRDTSRAQLARMIGPSESPHLRLLTKACRLSLRHTDSSARFESALRKYSPSLDAIWPALARHLASRSTAKDRVLLIDLAQNPEHREPPLSWGLQYIVRGDVMFEDGSVVTLDELTDEVGLPPLPYLEEVPDELVIDWDAKDKPNA